LPCGSAPLSGLSLTGIVWIVLGGVAIAGTLQAWYLKVFDQPPPSGFTKRLACGLGWVATLLAFLSLQVGIGTGVGTAGGRVVLALVLQFAVSVLFWWWTLYILLVGSVSWRTLFPSGMATAVCYTGLGVFGSLFVSSAIVSNVKSYGPIGAVMIMLSFLIGLGVVVHLGAVVGQMYNERGAGEPPS